MKNSNRLIALAVVLVASAVMSVTMWAQPNLNQCARTMCQDMRSCSTYVPQPSPQLEKTDKPSGKPSNLVEKQKGNDVQGEGPAMTCRFIAYMNYQECTFQGQGRVKPNDNTTGSTLKTTATTPKK